MVDMWRTLIEYQIIHSDRILRLILAIYGYRFVAYVPNGYRCVCDIQGFERLLMRRAQYKIMAKKQQEQKKNGTE